MTACPPIYPFVQAVTSANVDIFIILITHVSWHHKKVDIATTVTPTKRNQLKTNKLPQLRSTIWYKALFGIRNRIREGHLYFKQFWKRFNVHISISLPTNLFSTPIDNILVRSHDSRVYVTGTDPDLFRPRTVNSIPFLEITSGMFSAAIATITARK